ncbi:MAG: DUF6090 family protein [Parvularculaceae bacterium]
MILRRITEHVKAQNWFAVGIDFVIVVVGVFIGIQVANWNAAWADARRLEQQLSSLRVELEGNLARIGEYRKFAADQVATINELRAAFSDPTTADPDRIDALLFFSLRIFHLQPELVAYQELADSGGLRALAGTPAREALTQWEFDLAWVQRLDRDALAHRDDIVLPEFVGIASLAAAAENDPQQASTGFVRSRFRNDVSALAQSRELENLLALRFVIEAQSLEYSGRLEQSTAALITALKERKARQ